MRGAADDTLSLRSGSGPGSAPAIGRGLLVVVVAFLVTAALRLSFAGATGEDEAFFVIVGHNWLSGLLPYAHGYDVKPPGLFVLAAVAQLALGPTLASIKALEIAAVAVAAAVLHGLAWRHVSRPVAWWSLAAYPVATLFASGDTMPAILVQAPFVILAFWAVLEAGRGHRLRWLLLAGVLIGAAGMIKQTAIFEATALVGLAEFMRPERTHGLGSRLWSCLTSGVAICAGAMVIPAIFGLYFALHGLFDMAFSGVVLGAAERMRGDMMPADGASAARPLTLFDAVTRLPALLKPFIGLTSLALLAWMRHRRIAERLSDRWFVATIVWFVAALVGVLAVKAMYDHYMHAAIPPLVLAAGVFVCHGVEGATLSRRRLGGFVATVLAFGPALLLPRPLASEPVDMVAVRAAAARLRAAGSRPGDGLLVPLRGLPIHVEAQLFPTWRYIHHMHLICDFPAPDLNPLALALAEAPRFIVVADSTRSMACERADRHGELETALSSDYRSIGVGHGAWDFYEVYERVPPGRPPPR